MTFRLQIAISFFLILVLSGCSDIRTHQSSVFYDFNEKGLVPGKEYIFYPFEAADSSYINKEFEILLTLRYSDICTLKSLPLFIEYGSVKDSIRDKEILINLFDSVDNFSGKGAMGLYEIEYQLFPKQRFDDSLFISIASKATDTSGLLSMGLTYKEI